uniref:ELMO domain-containing protein n=1 Tax=Musa acuminata subsp. malaccensis TaxID=214687 RepID=A0A804J4Y2_MUSAM|nr:PREDICTED: ELMO domain-containing protein A-like isoform X3 [Musa acuminata subsp. malaccensis]
MRETDGKGGPFVAVRRVSQGPPRGSGCRSSPAEVVTGSTAWIGRGLSCVCAQRRDNNTRLLFDLTPSQEECLRRLQSRIDVAYDSSKKEHQEALWALWYAAYPGVELYGIISDQWKEMGWQGKDPSTDFRGGGFISLENLLFFAKNYPKSFQDLLQKREGVRAMWEYPFAVAGVNITFMLIQMLDLQAGLCSTDHNSQTNINDGISFLEATFGKRASFRYVVLHVFQDDGPAMARNARLLHGLQFGHEVDTPSA